jgi:hypothetical protein
MFLDWMSFLKEYNLNYFQNFLLQFFPLIYPPDEKFEEILNEINWNEKLDHLNDVDEICEQFTKYFLKIAKESIFQYVFGLDEFSKRI